MLLHIAYGIFLLPIQIVLALIELVKAKRFFSAWITLLVVSIIMGILLAGIFLSVDNIKIDDTGFIAVVVIELVGLLSAVGGFILWKRKTA